MAAEVAPGLEFLDELRATLDAFEHERRTRSAVRHA
jgi:hypothetical protein